MTLLVFRRILRNPVYWPLFLLFMIKIRERTTKGKDLFGSWCQKAVLFTALRQPRSSMEDMNQTELWERVRDDTAPQITPRDLLPASSQFLSFLQPPQIAPPDEIQGFKHKLVGTLLYLWAVTCSMAASCCLREQLELATYCGLRLVFQGFLN